MKQVFDKDIDMVESLQKAPVPDGIYINLDWRGHDPFVPHFGTGTYDDYISSREYHSLNDALKLLKKFPGIPVVFYGSELMDHVFRDIRFMEFVSHPNAYYLRTPFKLEEVSRMLALPTFRNPALEFAVQKLRENYEVADLRLEYSQEKGRYAQSAIESAKVRLGLTLTDKEIAGILSRQAELPEKDLGRFPGVFTDLEGTLLKDSEINQTGLKMLLSYAREHPVNLWIEGNYNEIFKVLPYSKLAEACEGVETNLHLRTPILNKHAFKGAKAEIVIGNLSQEKFEEQYRIIPETYIQVR